MMLAKSITDMSSARPHGRARIETILAIARAKSHLLVAPGPTVGRGLKHTNGDDTGVYNGVAPGPTVGRGLKQHESPLPLLCSLVAPGPTVGRGLKRQREVVLKHVGSGSARPHGRARIETCNTPAGTPANGCSARPHGRARIETNVMLCRPPAVIVAPGPTVGRGLKHQKRLLQIQI